MRFEKSDTTMIHSGCSLVAPIHAQRSPLDVLAHEWENRSKNDPNLVRVSRCTLVHFPSVTPTILHRIIVQSRPPRRPLHANKTYRFSKPPARANPCVVCVHIRQPWRSTVLLVLQETIAHPLKDGSSAKSSTYPAALGCENCAKTHSKARVRLSGGLNLLVAAGNDGLSTTAIDNSVLRL
jgi:hypothetical protein